jgi:hypothetical protein
MYWVDDTPAISRAYPMQYYIKILFYIVEEPPSNIQSEKNTTNMVNNKRRVFY